MSTTSQYRGSALTALAPADRTAVEALWAARAAESALEQMRRGSRETARDLYYDTYSLIRALRRHLNDRVRAA